MNDIPYGVLPLVTGNASTESGIKREMNPQEMEAFYNLVENKTKECGGDPIRGWYWAALNIEIVLQQLREHDDNVIWLSRNT